MNIGIKESKRIFFLPKTNQLYLGELRIKNNTLKWLKKNKSNYTYDHIIFWCLRNNLFFFFFFFEIDVWEIMCTLTHSRLQSWSWIMMEVVNKSGTSSGETCEIVKCHVYGGESTLLKINESPFDVQRKQTNLSFFSRGAYHCASSIPFYNMLPYCLLSMTYLAHSKPTIPKIKCESFRIQSLIRI